MITPVRNKADLLITPRNGGEPDEATNKRLAAARKQPDVPGDAPKTDDRAAHGRAPLQKAADIVNEVLRAADTRVNLQIDQESDQVVVKVLKESGEVIRQFPPKELLELAKYLSEIGTLPPGKGVLFEGRI
jgi:flagellar protein FlaG